MTHQKTEKKTQNVLLFKVGQRQTDFTRVQHLNVETTAVNLSAAPLSLAVASRSQPIGGGLGRIPPQPQVGSGGGADGGASLCRSYWWRRSSGETVLSLPRPFLLLPGTLGSGTAYSPPTTTGRKEWVRHGQVAETFFGEKKPPPNHQSWRRGEGASTLVFTLSVLVEVVFFFGSTSWTEGVESLTSGETTEWVFLSLQTLELPEERVHWRTHRGRWVQLPFVFSFFWSRVRVVVVVVVEVEVKRRS